MIKPHGSDTLNPLYVSDDAKRAELEKEAEGLPSIVISSAAAGNAVMMACGYFNPLTGFMNAADAMACAEGMKTTGGLFFPVPVVNVVPDAAAVADAKRIALRDPNVDGNPVLAIQDVEAIETFTDEQMAAMTMQVYATDDMEHPGVKAFNSTGKVCSAARSRCCTTPTSQWTSPRPSVPPCRSATRSRSAAGRRSWPSRLVTRCTGPTRSCAAWPTRTSTRTAS